ncbi:MAG TPA: DUF58 domain-containing protein [Chloroflexota bacterium]|nr:DUF58 domain-containing protein [Chloroflexota bacterium]
MPASFLDPALLRRLERLALVSRKRVAHQIKGERRSIQRGSSMNFVDYREYAPGDDIGQIDWNVYGRLDHLVVKLFEDEQNVTVHLLVDNSKSMDWGEPNKLRLALQLAGSLGYIGLSNFDRVQCATFSDTIGAGFGPAKGQREGHQMFDYLSRVEAAGQTDFEASLKAYALQNRRPGLAVIFTDLLSHSSFESGVKHLLERRYEVALVHILAPAEVNPGIGGDMKLIDRETGRFVDVTLNQRALNMYRERYNGWTSAIEGFCARHSILYEGIESSEPLDKLLFQTFRRKGLVA